MCTAYNAWYFHEKLPHAPSERAKWWNSRLWWESHTHKSVGLHTEMSIASATYLGWLHPMSLASQLIPRRNSFLPGTFFLQGPKPSWGIKWKKSMTEHWDTSPAEVKKKGKKSPKDGLSVLHRNWIFGPFFLLSGGRCVCVGDKRLQDEGWEGLESAVSKGPNEN